jgi:penicillin-binding protein 2
MDLKLESGSWRVVWDDKIILPELAGGNHLSLERAVPARGIIYDNAGNVLAGSTSAVAVGVYPSLVAEGDADRVISELARVSQRPITEISELLFPEEGEAPYYVPIAEVSQADFDERAGDWSELTGIYYRGYDTRLYSDREAGAQAIGYYSSIPAELVADYIPRGYQSDDKVGRQGLEAWGEEYLAGTRGGSLYVLNPAGEIITKLAESPAQAADSVYTTINSDLQFRAQEAIKDFTGAIVVLERDTGRVLAMVSSPSFNPNWADPNDDNSEWATYFEGGEDVFFNRATQGQYPPGSIFKVITFSAAIESGVFQPESTLDCVQEWHGLPNLTLYDWTLEKELPPSGTLTLVQGIMRSCNPWFYQIGMDLYNAGFKNAVAEMARGYGLGSPTGIQTLTEASGTIEDPDPSNEEVGRNQAVQQAFGQGTNLITPLQAAVYVAAVGNGGTLYEPQLVDRVVDANGVSVLDFQPQIKGTLPISQNTLDNLRAGMRMVTSDPRGTAYRRFTGFGIPVYGKTGTATAGEGEGVLPHAWFIGYTDAGRPNEPDIAIAVLVENIGDGSEFAAPIFRRVASYYFFDSAGPLYPWESDYGVLDPVYFDETLQAATATAQAEAGEGTVEVTPVP